MMDLEQRLRPIADRPVDITKPGWGLRLKQFPHPFDEAGVRPEAETLVQELINVYRASGEDEREAVRSYSRSIGPSPGRLAFRSSRQPRRIFVNTCSSFR
jgi:hypothetical protein